MADPVLTPIIVGVVISVVSGGIIAFLKRRWSIAKEKENKVEENTEAIRDMQKAIWRLNKTVLIMAKLQDDQTAKNHPELTSSLEDIAVELLKESDN